MSVIIIILYSLLIFIGLILLMPISLKGNISFNQESFSGNGCIGWAVGLFQLEINSAKKCFLKIAGMRFSISFIAKKIRFRNKNFRKKGTEKKKEKGKRNGNIFKLISLTNRRGILIEILMKLIRALNPQLQIRGIIGMGDPADMACLAGFIQLINNLKFKGINFDLDWDWIGEEIDVEINGSVRIWIIWLLMVMAAMLMSRDKRHVLRVIRSRA